MKSPKISFSVFKDKNGIEREIEVTSVNGKVTQVTEITPDGNSAPMDISEIPLNLIFCSNL